MPTRTIPGIFTGTPVLTPEKLVVLKEMYSIALSDLDMSVDAFTHEYYRGAADAVEDVLYLLHDRTVEITKRSIKSHNRNVVLITAATIGILVYSKYKKDHAPGTH